MKIATWNVNSVKARKDRLLRWLATHTPDVMCLQELKVDDAGFPHDDVRAAGYHAVVHGQKTYNGVAILCREEPHSVQAGLGDAVDDSQARLLELKVAGITVLSVYAPNGGETGSEKFVYKLAWLERLKAHLARYHDPAQSVVVCGDLNVAPEDADVARPEEWASSVLCAPEARSAFRELIAWGLRDCVRKHHPEPGLYSWWDYRMLGFPKNNGLRIDHILATEPMLARCSGASIDRQERKGKLPSDHVPVIAEFG